MIDIVWNNLQEILKKICLIEDLIEQLPLNRQLLKLKRRLLSNHGQPFWDACLDRHRLIQSSHNTHKLLFCLVHGNPYSSKVPIQFLSLN